MGTAPGGGERWDAGDYWSADATTPVATTAPVAGSISVKAAPSHAVNVRVQGGNGSPSGGGNANGGALDGAA
jgi:hypothetical protein